MMLKALQHSVFLQGMWDYVRSLKYDTYSFSKHHVMVHKVLWRNMQPIKLGTSGEPLLYR